MIQLAPQPLSNLQLELLKLYSTGISDEYLLELKDLIAQFLFEKARNQADQIWDEKGYSQTTIDQWLNED